MLADHVKRVSKRMFDVPDFFFYAIANGLDGLDEEPEEPCPFGSLAAMSGNATGQQRQRGLAFARPLGPRASRQPFCPLGIVQCFSPCVHNQDVG